MKKRLVFFFLLLLSPALSQRLWAEDWALVVMHADGNRSTFLLSEKPELTFSGDDCIFSSENATLTLSRADIAGFLFESAPSGVGSVKDDETLFRIVGRGIVSLVNVPAAAVRVYDLQGKRAKADISVNSQTTTISLEQLPEGVYVISYSGNAVKVKR